MSPLLYYKQIILSPPWWRPKVLPRQSRSQARSLCSGQRNTAQVSCGSFKRNLMVLVFLAMSQSNDCSMILIQVGFMHWWRWLAYFRSTAIWRWSWWKYVNEGHDATSQSHQLELPRKMLREDTGVWWPKKILRSFFAFRVTFAWPPWIRVPSAVAHPHIVACVGQKESQRFFRGSWYFQSSEYSGL